MMNNKEKKYIFRMFSSFAALWRTRDELSIKNIRKTHLQYFFLLPVLLVLVNMQNNYLRMPGMLFGLDSIRLMYICYCIGIVVMLVIGVQRWCLISRIMSGLCVCTIIAYIILPHGYAELYFALACWIGVGSLMAYAMYVFVFILNNTERLFGLLLAISAHGILMLLVGLGAENLFLSYIFPAILILLVAVCVFLTRIENITVPENKNKPQHPSIKLAMIFFAVSFLIDCASTILFNRLSSSYQIIDGIGIFAAIAICLIIQVVCKQSVWHLWNLFFIVAFLAHLLTLSENTVILQIAFFLHGVIYVGYIAIVYTIGGINKKYGSISSFRKSLMVLFGVLAPLQIILGYIQNHWPEVIFFSQ